MKGVAAAFGPLRYPVPREGQHGRVNCWFGKHWWALIRRDDGVPVAVVCPVCRKVLQVNDCETGPGSMAPRPHDGDGMHEPQRLAGAPGGPRSYSRPPGPTSDPAAIKSMAARQRARGVA